MLCWKATLARRGTALTWQRFRQSCSSLGFSVALATRCRAESSPTLETGMVSICRGEEAAYSVQVKGAVVNDRRHWSPVDTVEHMQSTNSFDVCTYVQVGGGGDCYSNGE